MSLFTFPVRNPITIALLSNLIGVFGLDKHTSGEIIVGSHWSGQEPSLPGVGIVFK